MKKEPWEKKLQVIHSDMEKLLKKHKLDTKTVIYAFEVNGDLCSQVRGSKLYLQATLAELTHQVNNLD